MMYRVWQSKLLLLKRIKRQSHTTLRRQILEEKQTNKWPGLLAEVSNICSELGIPDLNSHNAPAAHIKKAILHHHGKHMTEKIAKSKKMMKHKNENFSEVQK